MKRLIVFCFFVLISVSIHAAVPSIEYNPLEEWKGIKRTLSSEDHIYLATYLNHTLNQETLMGSVASNGFFVDLLKSASSLAARFIPEDGKIFHSLNQNDIDFNVNLHHNEIVFSKKVRQDLTLSFGLSEDEGIIAEMTFVLATM
ncbi:MAG: hypothetical protein HRT90_07635 [Candidatus Margulisbacteria bacterium]|nr:hypothetical protein [Candidatus Margulisiibacteriota bacterium]